jgi:hypothetical protein
MFSFMSPTIPAPIDQLLALFSTRLADVRFPDVDRASLARLAEQTHEARMALATAEAMVETAHAALREHQEELLRTAQRALAYARVYASADEALARELDAIALPRATRRTRAESGEGEARTTPADQGTAAPKRRGRPRKSDVAALSLDLPATSSAAE